MIRRIPALVLLALLSVSAVACSDDGGRSDASPTTSVSADCAPGRAAPPGTTTMSLAFGGLDRSYQVTVPDGYDGSTAAPLLLNLHGFGSNAKEQNEFTHMPERAGARGYVVVAPDGGPLKVPLGLNPDADKAADFEGMPFWNFFSPGAVSFGPGKDMGIDASTIGADDTAFVAALLDQIERRLCIDARRVFSTGMSNGAGMTTTLGCELGDRLAAIAPVSGVNLTGKCRGKSPIPVFAIHGEADVTAAYAGNGLMGFQMGNPSVADRMDQWAIHNGCKGGPTVTHPGPRVTLSVWNGCSADVRLETIAGWGHEWPRAAAPSDDGAIDATDLVLDYFDDHGGR